MKIHVDQNIFQKYSNVAIGYLVAQVVVKNKDPYVEKLKQSLMSHMLAMGINATNFAVHPSISCWRRIYREDFFIKESSYRSSIEALVRRIVTGKELWHICNVVDLYNCCSLLSMLPMGGYDLNKITGDIQFRYAKEGETFQGIGQKSSVDARSHHIVYADDARIMCWLWNHKDSHETCIDEQTKSAIFFIDAADCYDLQTMWKALDQLSENLQNIGGKTMTLGILNHHTPEINLGH